MCSLCPYIVCNCPGALSAPLVMHGLVLPNPWAWDCLVWDLLCRCPSQQCQLMLQPSFTNLNLIDCTGCLISHCLPLLWWFSQCWLEWVSDQPCSMSLFLSFSPWNLVLLKTFYSFPCIHFPLATYVPLLSTERAASHKQNTMAEMTFACFKDGNQIVHPCADALLYLLLNLVGKMWPEGQKVQCV